PCPAQIPAAGFVIRFDFRGLPKSNRSPRYWWLVLRTDDIEVCLKAPPGRDVDLVIAADLRMFTRVWLGYCGLAGTVERGRILLHGSARAIATGRSLVAPPDVPKLKSFRYSAWPSSGVVAAQYASAP